MGKAQHFWNKEYKNGRGKKGIRSSNLALSTDPSEDLMKFTRWLERESGKELLNIKGSVLDLGCGNGRNLIYMHDTYGMRGIGFDISNEAIAQAKKLSAGKPISYEARSIIGPLPVEDESQTIALDMMVPHFLNSEERKVLVKEIARTLKLGGYLYFKTFLLDDDLNAKRLLRENPAEEAGSYIHPKIGVAEHVSTEQEIREAFAEHFHIHKISKSHGHLRKGQAKRRSISVYAERVN